ncbi:MAG: AEC family transporter [Clostridia bacterium]|nr:AEC family transporter [Clostridia bacterium]
MTSLIFALNAVLPIVVIAVVGYLCKRVGLISVTTAKAMNKIVFRLLLPCMLFLNVYKIESPADFDFGYIWFALVLTLVFFLVGIPLCLLVTGQNRQRGPLLQAIFRSNYALIGIPLATSLYGEEGSIVATLLSAFSIPLYNVLAVICLSVFGDGERIDVKKILLGIYMYDFYNRKPVPNDLMELQCNYALELLKQGRIDGMIFEANSVMGARLPSEYWLREWVDKVKYTEVPD